MTSTRSINAAAGVIHAAMQQGKTLPIAYAYALDAACLLNSPELAAELVSLRTEVVELRARVAELEAQYLPVDEQRIPFALTPEALHASSGAAIEIPDAPLVEVNGCRHCGIPKRQHMQQWKPPVGWHQWAQPTQEQIKERMLRRRSVNELRALLAGQREDAYRSPLHHDYRTPHDLPEPGVKS